VSSEDAGRRRTDTSSVAVTVRLLVPRETEDLRRDVLRAGLEDAVVHYPCDDDPATWHLGAVDGSGRVVATSTFFPETCPVCPDVLGAVRLRGMAVASHLQGQGVGARVLERAVERLTAAGAPLVWANARDGALGFYVGRGFEVTDRRFVDVDTGLDHTVVVREVGNASAGKVRP
jgi:GNAT superfamily N-acetyltransferase